jgi:50S ribosomal protein L16 3-hydroxylase
LDRRTQLLYDSHNVFLNGSTLDSAGCDSAVIRHLANARHLSGVKLAGANPTRAAAVALFHRWYRDGFLHLG